MPKLWNLGQPAPENVGVPTIKKSENGQLRHYVQVPKTHTGGREELHEHQEGHVYLSIEEHGFFVVPKGASFDVPHGVPVSVIKAMAPQLVDEAEKLALEAEEKAKASAPAKPAPKEK